MNVLKALKIECDKSLKHYDTSHCINDQGYLSYGAFNTDIARQLSDDHHTISKQKCRYHLKILEKNGKVISRPCPGGLTRWWPVGYRPSK